MAFCLCCPFCLCRPCHPQDILIGQAKFVDNHTIKYGLPGRVDVGGQVTAKDVIIATGSVPFVPPGEGCTLGTWAGLLQATLAELPSQQHSGCSIRMRSAALMRDEWAGTSQARQTGVQCSSRRQWAVLFTCPPVVWGPASLLSLTTVHLHPKYGGMC